MLVRGLNLHEWEARTDKLPAQEKYFEQLNIHDAILKADDVISMLAKQWHGMIMGSKAYQAAGKSVMEVNGDVSRLQTKAAQAPMARNRAAEARKNLERHWRIEIADHLLQDPNMAGHMAREILKIAALYPQQYGTARRMVNNAIMRRLLDPLQDSRSANTRHALTRDWLAIKKDAYSDAEIPIEDLKQLGLQHWCL